MTDIEANAFTENSFPSSYVVSILNENATVNDIAFDSGVIVAIEGTASCFEIANNALSDYYCMSQEITIPDGVTSIEDGAFEGKGLTSVTFPQTLTNIKANAFKDNNLMDITIPETVAEIGDNAFDGNLNLAWIYISNSSASVGTNAFPNGHGVVTNSACFEFDSTDPNQINDYYDNENEDSNDPACPKDVVIPQGVTAIGESAFQSKSLTSVVIPNSMVSIGQYAFDTNSLASVIIPDSVTSVGNWTFGLNSLTSVTIGSGLTSIAGAMFYNNSLESIEIPEGITSIGEGAFNNNSLASVTIPDSVTSIGDNAFYNNSLASVIIGSGITSIGGWAFGVNNDLSSICIERVAAGLTIGNSAFPSSVTIDYQSDGDCSN